MASQLGVDFDFQDIVLTPIDQIHENGDMFDSNRSYTSSNTTKDYITSYDSIGYSDTQYQSSVDNSLSFHAATRAGISSPPAHPQLSAYNSNEVPQFVQGDAYGEEAPAEQMNALRGHGLLDHALVNTAVSLTYMAGERANSDDTPQDQELEWTLSRLLPQFNHNAGSSHYPDQLRQTDVHFHDQAPSHNTIAAQNLDLGSFQTYAGLDNQSFGPGVSEIVAQSSNAQTQTQVTLRSDLVGQLPSNNAADGLVCDICGPTKCHSEASLRSHIKKLHRNVTKHGCQYCNLDFTEMKDLRRHTNSVHERKIAYWCTICGQGFSRNDNGRRHSKKCSV